MLKVLYHHYILHIHTYVDDEWIIEHKHNDVFRLLGEFIKWPR